MYIVIGYIMAMDSVIIRIIDLPYGVGGLTVKDSEGDYNVYLNARYSLNRRVAFFRHELEHIKNGDFYTEEDVRDKEDRIPF